MREGGGVARRRRRRAPGHVPPAFGRAGSFRSVRSEPTRRRRTRSAAPRERALGRLRLPPRNSAAMPPERRKRLKPGRRPGAGAGPGRKKPEGRGGPRRKAAPASQGERPARPSLPAVDAEEERRLRRQNRLALEEDKPEVERCLEELVFGHVEDDRDALLRRLRGPRVRAGSGAGPGPPAAGGTRGPAH